jgi:hypothetical protein
MAHQGFTQWLAVRLTQDVHPVPEDRDGIRTSATHVYVEGLAAGSATGLWRAMKDQVRR